MSDPYAIYVHRVDFAMRLIDDEIGVLKLVAQGKSQKEIAEALHWSANTINRRCCQVCNKLDAANIQEALLVALANDLLRLELI